jgi:hypothetical protein
MKYYIYFLTVISLATLCVVQNNRLNNMPEKVVVEYVTMEVPTQEVENVYDLAEPFDSGDTVTKRIDCLLHHLEMEGKEKPSMDWIIMVLSAAQMELNND